MAGKLAVTTIIPAPAGSGEPYLMYGPDSAEIPEEHARMIGAHAWEDGVHPYGDASERGEGEAPPRAGSGSGRDQWAAFCEENGVEVSDEDKRDDLIRKCEEAGVIDAG